MSTDTTTTSTAVPLAEHLHVFTLLHGAMRRDVQRFVTALHALAPQDRRAARRLRRWYAAFADALGHHHRLEDDYFWPALRERLPDAAAVESTMHAEHEELEAALALMARRLDDLAASSGDDWRPAHVAARQAAASLRSVLTSHLADEESTALTLMGTHLSPEEFGAVDQRAQRAAGLRYVGFALPWLLDGMDADGAAQLLAPAPAPFRWLLRLRWQPRYRRLTAPLRAAN